MYRVYSSWSRSKKPSHKSSTVKAQPDQHRSRVCKSYTSLPRCCQPAWKLQFINMYGKSTFVWKILVGPVTKKHQYWKRGNGKIWKNRYWKHGNGFSWRTWHCDVFCVAQSGLSPPPFSWSFAKLRGWKVAKSKLEFGISIVNRESKRSQGNLHYLCLMLLDTYGLEHFFKISSVQHGSMV